MGTVREPVTQYNGTHLVSSHGWHKPKRIVLHDTESHDHAGIQDLQGIASFWKSQGLGYGAHIGVDADGNSARYVDDDDIGWHVQSHNTGSLGIEMIGFASFTKQSWMKRQKQLHKTARWMAHWSKKWDIPLVKDVERGVSTHDMCSKAFGGSHYDPGKGFPFYYVLFLARIYKKTGW